jgi:hypothetical protein
LRIDEGLNIHHLERHGNLKEVGAAAAGAALTALAADPRSNPVRLGVLGFGAGARLALELPGTEARALIYPGYGSLAGARKLAGATASAPLAHRVTWMGDAGIREFLGPAEYAWNSNISGSAPGFALRATGAEVEHRQVPSASDSRDLPPLGTLRPNDWPGEVRELRNGIEPGIALSEAEEPSSANLFPEPAPEPPPNPHDSSLEDSLDMAARHAFEEALRRALKETQRGE